MQMMAIFKQLKELEEPSKIESLDGAKVNALRRAELALF